MLDVAGLLNTSLRTRRSEVRILPSAPFLFIKSSGLLFGWPFFFFLPRLKISKKPFRRAQCDPAFRKTLLQEGVECLLAGDIDTGKAVLRDYINATIGFEELSRVFDKSSKSLMRMFGPKGDPQASNLFAVIQYLQEQERIHLEVKARKVA